MFALVCGGSRRMSGVHDLNRRDPLALDGEAQEARWRGPVLHADQGLTHAIQPVDPEDPGRARGIEQAHAARLEVHDEDALAVRAQGQALQRHERLAGRHHLERAAIGGQPIEGG